MARSLGSL